MSHSFSQIWSLEEPYDKIKESYNCNNLFLCIWQSIVHVIVYSLIQAMSNLSMEMKLSFVCKTHQNFIPIPFYESKYPFLQLYKPSKSLARATKINNKPHSSIDVLPKT